MYLKQLWEVEVCQNFFEKLASVFAFAGIWYKPLSMSNMLLTSM